MLKNITFSAEEDLIKKARTKASLQNSTLNNAFRAWLQWFASSDTTDTDYRTFMKKLSYVKPGRTFSRDELNER